MKIQPVTLTTIANGAIEERFQVEMDRILTNIEDENTAPRKVRSLVIEMLIKPNEDRTVGEVLIQARCKLAPVKPLCRHWMFGRQAGAPVAVENDVDQTQLFDPEPAALRLAPGKEE